MKPFNSIDSDKFPQILAIEREVSAIDRIQQYLQVNDNSLLFSVHELNYCQKKPNYLLSLSGLWCAKQAFTKALQLIENRLQVTENGVSFISLLDFCWLDIEINHTPIGQPLIMLHDRIAYYFQIKKIAVEVSIAHLEEFAVAVVVLYEVASSK
jgi:phosphopantetheine--protein transferase-like protein